MQPFFPCEPAPTIFAVQEKAAGVPLTLFCDDFCFKALWRGSAPSPGIAIDFPARYGPRTYMLYQMILREYPGISGICVNGNLIGGAYPHPDVPPQPGCRPLSEDVWYAPGYEIYAYDVRAIVPEGSFYLPVETAARHLREAGFLYARTLLTAPLEQCRCYPEAFPTLIPRQLGLPPLPGNTACGTVIKPCRGRRLDARF